MGQIKNIKLHIVTDIKYKQQQQHGIRDPVGEDDNKCHVDFEILNDNDDWSVHYEWADERVAELRGDGKRVINLTHTINTESRGVTVLFYEHHNPYQFL